MNLVKIRTSAICAPEVYVKCMSNLTVLYLLYYMNLVNASKNVLTDSSPHLTADAQNCFVFYGANLIYAIIKMVF